jgi:diguanylate cyclase (GGDEF)-like protein
MLERLLTSDVLIAVNESTGPRVVGFSGRVDKRAMHTTATPDSPMARVARGEVPYLRVGEDPLGRSLPDRRQSRLMVTVVPFADGPECVGAIALWLPDGRRPGTPAMVEAETAIRRTVPRMQLAGHMQKEEEKSISDPLTGLKNRRGLAAEMERLGQEQGALVYADLDKFKSLNDTLGHPAGDAALVHFAGLLRRLMRDGDVVARIGGEEFAVWAPNAALDRGVQIAERIRGALEVTPWGWQGRTWPLTASFGVAACPETSPSQKNLPAQADAALYQAKKGGRNRVVAADRK